MPAVVWDLAHALPRFLRYRVRERFDGSAIMSALEGWLDFPTWLVTGPPSVAIAANKKEQWAVGALRFEKRTDVRDFPF